MGSNRFGSDHYLNKKLTTHDKEATARHSTLDYIKTLHSLINHLLSIQNNCQLEEFLFETKQWLL